MADVKRIGPYRVLGNLGGGGMGKVVLAHDDRLDRLVAIKRLHDDLAATAHSRERFRREARIAARLNHPAIVQLYDVFHEADHDYLIMEYVEGQTLLERRDAGPMTVSEVLRIAHQLALGMAAAHDLGIVHRDLKAENVLLTSAGRAKITDFGIAKIPGEDTVTAEGNVLGTFRAMSPEQALGRPVDHRSDLFSFGILLYEAISGHSPFRSDTPYLTVQRLVLDEPRPIPELVPDIPAGLASLIHQLLAKEPMLRPRNFHEVADLLIELAGEACDGPCQGGSPVGGPAGDGGDRRPTDESRAPIDYRTGPATQPLHGARIDDSTGAGDARDEDEPAADDSGDRNRSPDAYAHTQAPPKRRRPRLVVLGAAIVGALGIGYGVHHRDSGRLVRVAVLAPRVSGADGNAGVSLLAIAIRTAVMSDIRARTGLELVPRDEIDIYVDGATRSGGPPPNQRALRSAVGADEIIATDLDCRADSCRLGLERDPGRPGGPPTESFQLATDAAAFPGATIAIHLSRLYPDHPARGTPYAAAIDPRDHERFLQLVHDYWAGGENAAPDYVFTELERIRGRSPRSIEILLFEAELLLHQYLRTLDPDTARRALTRLQAADRLFPDTYDIISARFDIELYAGRIDDANATFDRLATLDPDSRTTHLQRAKLAQARGQFDKARAELDAAAQRDTSSWSVPYYRARLLNAVDDHAGARKAVADLLTRSPGNYAGLAMRAYDQLDTGHFACAEQSYARLVTRVPYYTECANLGYVRNQLGRYRDAIVNFRCALDSRPDDPTAQLGLAESLLLAGEPAAADAQLRTLRESLARRRHSTSDNALHGSDLETEAQTLAYIGLRDAEMAREARIRIAPLFQAVSKRDALYTAALVHTVLGDRELAIKYITEYLDHKYPAADFSLAWFEPLRRDPVLKPRFTIEPEPAPCDDAVAP